MPPVRITLKGRPKESAKKIGGIVARTIVEILHVPGKDKMQVITEYGDSLTYDSSDGETQRDNVVMIQITLTEGRKAELKNKLFNAMVKRLTRTASRLGRDVRIVQEAGERLPFDDASFDCVVTTLVLCMVRDHDRVVREAKRVLRPGGAFFFYEHVVSPRRAGHWWQNKLNPTWKFLTTGCNLNRDITSTIRGAGFTEVELKTFDLSVGLPVTIPNIVGVARV